MQLRQAVTAAFLKKGYQLQSPITRKQFIKVMKQLNLETNSMQKLFNQSLLNEIWTETETQVTKQRDTKAKVTTQDIIQYLLDAIQILSNRITECSNTISQMQTKRKQLQQQNDYTRAEILHHKMVTLKADLKQFQLDFKSLTFLFDKNAAELSKQMAIRKYSQQKPHIMAKNQNEEMPPNAPTQVKVNPFCNCFQAQKKQRFSQLQQFLKDNNNQPLDFQTVQDSRTAALWILGLLICLQCTVMILKYCFLNVPKFINPQLLVFLLGLFILLEDYRPSMSKIAVYGCLITVLIDVLWLVVFSPLYLHGEKNGGLTHFAKSYQLYIWFQTIVQLFVKMIYIWLLNRYQYYQLVIKQQQEKMNYVHQQLQGVNVNNRELYDHYIPDMKEFLKIQNVEGKVEGKE